MVADRNTQGPIEEDKRLARLYDYTKFHIGIYLTIGSAMVALLGSKEPAAWVSLLVDRRFILASLFFITIAGISGGVIASTCVICHSFEEFWEQKQGPFFKFLKGKSWASVEHIAFWLSLGCLIIPPFLSDAKVRVNWADFLFWIAP
jgi:hypothetical protein